MTETSVSSSVLVIGGGIAGARVAQELTDSGVSVYLIERTPSLGGVTSQLGYMFPHHNCLLCRGNSDHGYGCTRPSTSPDMLDFNRPENLHVLPLSEVADLRGEQGNFTATIRTYPRYVDTSLCINCNKCSEVCPVEVTDRYQPDRRSHKAAYKPDWRSIPNAYVIDKGEYCLGCDKCTEICPTRAIDLTRLEQLTDIQVGAVVLATGYRLHDPAASPELGYGRVPNVLTGFEFERLLSPAGPTGGRIRRPSDGTTPRRIAWLQCVGSRDKDHDYCSAFCCMYATKQAALVREALPDSECEIFFMDDRVFGKQFLDTYEAIRKAYGIRYTRCRLYDVREDRESGQIAFRYLAEGRELQEAHFDLMVLSIGAEAPTASQSLTQVLGIATNSYGFVRTHELLPGLTDRPGIFVCGCSASPKDIADTTTEAMGVACQVLAALREEGIAAVRAGDTGPAAPMEVAEPRAGVFICRCGEEIGGIVDVDELIDYASRLPGVIHAQPVAFGCLPEGRAEIGRAIAAHDLNRLIVGACTPRTHIPIFRKLLENSGNDPNLVEFVGLREFCTWPHRDQPEMATRKAKELLRRAALRTETLEPITQNESTCQRALLVIGGGLSGMTAALHAADRGLTVHLLEKEGTLGGNFARIRYFPGGTPPDATLTDLIHRVMNHEHITVYLHTEVVQNTGRAGDFHTVLRRRTNGQGPPEQTIRPGAVILASGAQEYRGAAFGLGKDERIVTQLDLENEIAAQPDRVTGWQSVVMINCVGPWNEEPSTPWRCSRNCCIQVLKNALRIKSLNPSCQVVVFIRETMTTGFFEELYTEARRQGVIFVRYTSQLTPEVALENGRVAVRFTDLSLGHLIELTPDRVALAVALSPNPDNRRLADMFDVDVLGDGFFAETEPKQRAVEFHRPGVYLCGLAHGPKSSQLNIAQALGAAERAVRLLSPGALLSRRMVAVVDESRCMGCLTCVRTCPYGVPTIDSHREGKGGIMGASYIDPTRCEGCGTCPSECPGKAISLNYYRDEQVMVALGSWQA